MIIHCTQKLAQRLPEQIPKSQAEMSPIGSWHANLYQIDRRHCVIFCHDNTRYMLLVAGLIKPNFSELGLLFRAVFLQSLAAEGCSDNQIRKVTMAMGPIHFDCSTDRSVLGTLTVARADLDAYLYEYANVLDLDPFDVAKWLNSRVTTAKSRVIRPRESMLELVRAL